MEYQFFPLKLKDISQASVLDKKWFGEQGISSEELHDNLEKNQYSSIGIFQDNELLGFTTFEVLDGHLPKDYKGNISYNGKVFFIQQFTTVSNYEKGNRNIDEQLLLAVEQKAAELGCLEVWEALSMDHPYKKENNSAFDAFGFYENNGYIADENQLLTWQPTKDVSVTCFLFRKSL